jgi:hypothetical protein
LVPRSSVSGRDTEVGVVATLLIGGIGTAIFNAQITAAAASAVPPNPAATAISVTTRHRLAAHSHRVDQRSAEKQRPVLLHDRV